MDSPFRRVAAIATLAFVTAVPFAFAAGPPSAAAPKPAFRPATPALPATLVVPDLKGQPYVFAEGTLEDAGFSWYVPGANGFAANTVVAQSPAPGTHLVDTGAPLVTLTLARNHVYGQRGKAQNKSPYHGTAVRSATS